MARLWSNVSAGEKRGEKGRENATTLATPYPSFLFYRARYHARKRDKKWYRRGGGEKEKREPYLSYFLSAARLAAKPVQRRREEKEPFNALDRSLVSAGEKKGGDRGGGKKRKKNSSHPSLSTLLFRSTKEEKGRKLLPYISNLDRFEGTRIYLMGQKEGEKEREGVAFFFFPSSFPSSFLPVRACTKVYLEEGRKKEKKTPFNSDQD